MIQANLDPVYVKKAVVSTMGPLQQPLGRRIAAATVVLIYVFGDGCVQ